MPLWLVEIQGIITLTDYLTAQDVFSKGELAPSMYARITTVPYFKGLKTATNVLPIPQGGARKRFGTLYQNTLSQVDYTKIRPFRFHYLNECVYQIIFYDDAIDIWLEGNLIATVSSSEIVEEYLSILDTTVLENRLRATVGYISPKDLSRAPDSANVIMAFGADTLMATNAITEGWILPARFTTTGTLPTSEPQLKLNRTYFIKVFAANTFAVYDNVDDARNDVRRYTFTTIGTGTNNLLVQNTWSFSAVTFRNLPVMDFDGGYDAITFTPGATSGSTTLTASAGIFTAAHVGGLFAGAGATARITGYTSNVLVNIDVTEDFPSTNPIPGRVSVLAEPAWSDDRGWPRVCSSFQNRAFFANTELVPNGVWGSVINDYEDFDDSNLDDDMAISWQPTSDTVNYIKFLTPFRTLLAHTNTGVYSTPMTIEVAITPRNFFLTLQDNTPTASIQPVTIDNQVIVLSGRDVHSLEFENAQQAFLPSLVSAINEHLIKSDAVDIKPFKDRQTAGGSYVFLTNLDGTMAMYQTLVTENVSGWTPANLYQSFGDAKFRYIMTSHDGRCWFINERELTTQQAAVLIDGSLPASNLLQATGLVQNNDTPTPIAFTTSDTLPQTSPQIVTGKIYWAKNPIGPFFSIYATQEDALNGTNVFTIVDHGIASQVITFTLSTKLVLEELSYDVKTDCTITKSETTPFTSIDDLTVFNAQIATIKADGKRFDDTPIISNTTDVKIMGDLTEVSQSEVGFPIQLRVIPMPLSISMGQTIQTSNLTSSKHIKYADLIFYNTWGGKVNRQNISLTKLEQFQFGAPEGQMGIMRVSIMSGWDDFATVPFEITHDDPYDFNLLGIFYKADV